MLTLRRILATICYAAMLAADAAAVWVIYKSIYGGMTYYLGLLIFVPLFIFTYWMSTFFSQLTSGKVGSKRIIPKWLRTLLNVLGNIISLALIAFWGYIFVTQSLYEAPNENLVEESVKIFTGLH
jgi:hypothetical protein